MGIVEKHEAAAQEIGADADGFGFGEDPSAGIFDKDPGPVVDVVACRVDHVLADIRIDARQANDALDELAIRFRIIGGPALEAAKAAVGHVVVKTRKGPFDFLFGTDGHVLFVFFFLVSAAPALVSEQAGGKAEEEQCREEEYEAPPESLLREFHGLLSE